MMIDMPSALGRLYATGQDDHADQHLGAFLEWIKPADGSIHARVMAAEARPASTATAPDLDNRELAWRLEQYRLARRLRDTATIARIQSDIEAFLYDEVRHRYALIIDALGYA